MSSRCRHVLYSLTCLILASQGPAPAYADHGAGSHVDFGLSAPSADLNGIYYVSWTNNVLKTLQEKKNSGSYSNIYTGTALSKRITGRTYGIHTYRLKAEACFLGSCIDVYTAPISVDVLGPPETPVLSTQSTDSDGNYTVSWTAEAGAVAYRLEERFNSGSWAQIHNGSSTSKSRSNPTQGTYSYRVRACSSTSVSSCSPFSSVKSTVVARPDAPTLSVPSTDNDGSYTVSWNSVALATRYVLYERLGSGSWGAPIHNSSGTSKFRSGRADGTWSYRVQGCKNSSSLSCGDFSTIKSVVVSSPPPAPSAPSSLSAPGSASGPFQLTWTSVSGATSYEVYERPPGGSWEAPVATSNLYLDINPQSNGTHQYRVKACNASGCSSGYSPTVSVDVTLPPAGTTVLNGPNDSDDGSVGLTWSAVSGATSYELQRRVDGGSWSSPISTDALLSHTDNGLADGTWGYRIRACSASGCSSTWSPVKSVILAMKPGVPQAFSGPSDSLPGEAFIISWSPPAGGNVDYYELERQLDSEGSWTTLPAISGLSYEEPDPAADVYLYRVSACNTEATFTSCSAPTDTHAVAVNEVEEMGLSVPAEVVMNAGYDVTWTASGVRLLQESTDGVTWTTIYGGQDRIKAVTGKFNGTYRYRLAEIRIMSGEFGGEEYYVYSPIETVDVGQSDEPEPADLIAAGNIPYDAGVTKGGNAYVTVPIAPAPGVNGLVPALSLAHSSGRDRQRIDQQLPGDTLGYGFSLNGIPSIRRCVKTQPNAVDVTLDDSQDLLCLNGEPLVLTLGTYLVPGSEYRTLRESYQKIVMQGTAAESWFEVHAPDGSVMEFGRGENSRVRAVRYDTINGEDYARYSKPYRWWVNWHRDAFGNAMTYTYFKDEAAGVNHPWTITYGNNGDAEIRFDYVTRDDLADVQLGTESLHQPLLLHTIRVSLEGNTVREYRIMSETAPGPENWRRIDWIQLCGYAEDGVPPPKCLEPLEMDWAEPSEDLDDLDTYLSRLTDSYGRVTEFDHGIVEESGSQSFVFTETPFGAPTTVPDTQALTSPPEHGGVKSVVTQIRRSDGIGGWHRTNYAYQGRGLESTNNWGYLGFYATRIEDVQSGIVTYHQYRLDFPHFADTVATKQFDGIYGSHTEMLTDVEIRLSAKTITHGSGGTTYLPFAENTIATLLEGGTTLGYAQSNTTLTMNGGFVGTATTVSSTGTGRTVALSAPSGWGGKPSYTLTGVTRSAETVQTLSNLVSGSDWLIGFPDLITDKRFKGTTATTPDQIQSVDFNRLTGTNVVDTATRFPGDANLELVTDYDYEPNGDIRTQTISGTNDVPARTVTANNYLDGRYPAYVSNAVGHDTQVRFDPRFGLAKQVTDPNDRISRVTYDAFGRVSAATSPDDVVTTTTYARCVIVGCPSVGSISPVTRVETDSSIAPRTRTYLDALGRVIRSEVESFDGTFVRTDTEYDSQGRVDRSSQPYLAGGTRYFTDFDYDIRDRVKVIDPPNDARTDVVYSVETSTGVRVTLTDTVKRADGSALPNQVRVNIYNLTGDLVTSIDDSTGKNVRTDYDYYGSSLPESVTVDPAGAAMVSSFVFDDAGNREQLTGPDVGTITTAFTALGQPKQVTDNAGQVTTMIYDLLGRLRTQTDPDDIASWDYDTALNGKGLLASRSYGAVFTETLTYDSDSRPDTVTTTLTGGGLTKTYTRSYGFDTSGRLESVTHPSGAVIQYGYNTRGYLETLTDVTSGSSVLQTITALDAYGNVTGEDLGNGVASTRGYDPMTGWLETVDTTNGATVVQDNTYAWQSNGILESRLKQVGSTAYQEVFEHDGLNRLETSRTYVNSVLSRTLSNAYDLRGNLSSKTSDIISDVDVTAYTPVAGKNRLDSATIGGVATTFVADDNGNITQYHRATGDDKFIDWNARNLPISVLVGSAPTDPTPTARDSFAYGPDRQRFYKQSTWDDGGTQKTEHTFYVGTFEERITDNSHPTHKSVQKVRVGQSIVHLAKTDWSNQVTRSVEYLHRDHLGSIEAVTDASGTTIETFGFDPFGGRRQADWSRAPTPAEKLSLADGLDEPAPRGYTDHEMLDRTGLIHMNGRVYDAEIGRFLSPDPHVTYPTFSQSYNRYAYVLNNPMAMTDPTGLDGTDDNELTRGIRDRDTDNRGGLGGSNWVTGAYTQAGFGMLPWVTFGNFPGAAGGGTTEQSRPVTIDTGMRLNSSEGISLEDARGETDEPAGFFGTVSRFGAGLLPYGDAGYEIVVNQDYDSALRSAGLEASMTAGGAAIGAMFGGVGAAPGALIGYTSAKVVRFGRSVWRVFKSKKDVTSVPSGTHRNGIYEIISEQPIAGATRSAHRASANRAFLNAVENDPVFAGQLGDILGVKDVADFMRSGRSGLRNPPGTEWHHPFDNPEVMQLLRREVHRHPELRDILHPDNIGGFGRYFGE